MSDFLQMVSTLREQMNATLSRSDVLKPLAWLVGLLVAAAGLLVFSGKAPDWLLVTIGVSLAASVAIYVASYLYCLFRNPDALRSEKYSLHKMAIEHGIYGDSNSGVMVPPPSDNTIALPTQPTRTIGGPKS
jgi:hypothetical protein